MEFVPAWAIEGDAPAGLGDLPHRQLALDPVHAALLQELLGAEADAVDELADVLAAGQARASGRPAPGCSARGRPRRPARPACRATSGRGSPPATCRCPRAGRAPSSTGAAVWRARSSGETSTSSSSSPVIAVGQRWRLALAELGQRRVDDVEPVAHPLRLAVTDQHQLHRARRTSTVPHRERLVSRPDGSLRVPLPQRPVWTADVADGGQRFVDPLTAGLRHRAARTDRSDRLGTRGRAGNGLAIAGMVCGIVAVVMPGSRSSASLGIVAAIVGLACRSRACAARDRPGAARASPSPAS